MGVCAINLTSHPEGYIPPRSFVMSLQAVPPLCTIAWTPPTPERSRFQMLLRMGGRETGRRKGDMLDTRSTRARVLTRMPVTRIVKATPARSLRLSGQSLPFSYGRWHGAYDGRQMRWCRARPCGPALYMCDFVPCPINE